ncbi:NAD(P)/FAD-dependent oxidoreductase [Singulisphaera acidiphila]|uniref:NADH:ubiquinone reductase (non-electrogenic) n=1 Tax=Singulisphaera acidiphila (strain ATCC BAA-1392 / DSM 18658 / VKM B-2454 / MOB10) TaxID=886293 RepID=L0DG27_SINAD|nr:NAD(P)/FAD-dependent oxidoreductase [Singulisphaera acidiphila]AGA27621.1 NADH dehydrogenase, FAD-containing subunit [Singulisphaera acidiphila DSM 18658]
MTESRQPRIVIIGGGFGGLSAARELRRAQARLTLVDRQNHHLFQPLLYQVATAALNPSDIASPIRRILRNQKNVEVLLGEVTAIDLEAKQVVLPEESLQFDYLIVATGASHSYFGHDEWASFAPGLKSIDDALEIRRRVLFAFEAAERELDPARRHAWLTFVIVGAGPTGVELAGALAEIAHHALARDFRHIDPTQASIILLEGSPRVLPTYVEPLSEKAREQLVAMSVEVRTGQMVTAIDAEGVSVGPERIEARTVLWAAGVAASPLARSLGVPLDRAGRVRVNPDLTIPGRDNVYVVGDLASLDQDGKPIPGVAPAAMQEAVHAAKNIERTLRGQARLPFRYHDKGSLATIGRAAAVADFGRIKLSGLVAWLAWLFVHVLFLIGFRNRFVVLFEWAWSYVTYDRGARLITGSPSRRLVAEPEDREPESIAGTGKGVGDG